MLAGIWCGLTGVDADTGIPGAGSPGATAGSAGFVELDSGRLGADAGSAD